MSEHHGVTEKQGEAAERDSRQARSAVAASPVGPVPSRRVLVRAEQENDRLGHENLGFLSESHGFLPRRPPSLRLPPSHRLWDDMAARIPEMFRSLTLRESLDRMPVLGAAPDDLDDRHLLRASVMFSIFAHAYHYVDPEPPAVIPDSILRPWAQISDRLQRPAPHLSFTDLNVYNWRLIDPSRPDAVCAENLMLLVPILGNEDERRFQMTTVEIVAEFTPIVAAAVRAQEAVVADSLDDLGRELVAITGTLAHLGLETFAKVDPNPYARQHVDPVVWGKTVAPLATPYQADDPPPGPSGTAIPAFQLLDSLFGRRHHATTIGVETARVRSWFPPHWRGFLDAFDAVSVSRYVAERGDRALAGLFQECREAYAGDGGLLGRHRLKTFGFLDLSFKAGRSKTLAGFSGGFNDRPWDRMDVELSAARLERYPAAPQTCHHARVAGVSVLRGDDRAWVGDIVLDVAGAGIRYVPGSRCAVLPENTDDLVARTLSALRARGDEPIQLDGPWREAVKLRDGWPDARVLPLRTLLRFGHIRPVPRAVAKALHRISQNETLRRVVEARAEDQWELWELLAMLAETGFKPARLWKAHPGEREGICRVVPPASFRMYSVSSAVPGTSADDVRELHLTVGRLRYDTAATEVSPAGSHVGTASDYLSRLGAGVVPGSPRLSVRVVQPPNFALPADHRRPVVMFAGGTGVSPFIGMLIERSRQPGAGENWLFLAARTAADVHHGELLERLVALGHLELRVALSGDDARGPRRHIGEEMLAEANARCLWELLRSVDDGGRGASFYVCGRTGFASAVTDGVRKLLARYDDGPTGQRGERADQALFRLIGEKRYLQEIFTTYPGPQTESLPTYDASEIACHNDEDHGLWMTIDGRVYDVTEFARMHPGGPKIVRSYAGMDATDAYRRVRHDVNPEVDAMLPMYEIGSVRRLDFGAAWGTAISAHGLRLVTLKDAYRAWVGLLFSAVEMENALGMDYGIRDEPVTHDEGRGTTSASPYKTRLLLHTHERFLHEYLPTLTGDRLGDLWAVTSGLASDRHHVRWMSDRITRVACSPDAAAAAAFAPRVAHRLRDAAGELGSSGEVVAQWAERCSRLLEREDRRLLRELKLTLSDGVAAFERGEGQTIVHGGQDLVATARVIPGLMAGYWSRCAEADAQAGEPGG